MIIIKLIFNFVLKIPCYTSESFTISVVSFTLNRIKYKHNLKLDIWRLLISKKLIYTEMDRFIKGKSYAYLPYYGSYL